MAIERQSRVNYALSPAERLDARRALRLISDRAVTLVECVRVALAIGVGPAVRTPVDIAVETFLGAILRRGRRDGTFRFYEERLAWFIRVSAGATLDDWDRPKLKRRLEEMGRSPTTIRMTFRAIRALYRFSLQQDPPLVAANPTADLVLDLATPVRKVRFLTIDQVQAVLGIEVPLFPAVVLQLFAGVRPEEIAPRGLKPRLQWEAIDFHARTIRVDAEVAKTKVPRVIQNLPDTVWEWLAACKVERKGSVCTCTAKWLTRQMRDLTGGEWIQDGLRHTFATYMMAATSNAAQVAEWLGHEGELRTFHNHYRGLAHQSAGFEFVALRPALEDNSS